jgi:prepilin-type processing-associated H-X9-DG protein
VCQDHIKNFALACVNYETTNKYYPRGASWSAPDAFQGDANYKCHSNQGSWIVQILPYIEMEHLWRAIPYKGYWDGSNPSDTKNDAILSAVQAGVLPAYLPVARCPSDSWDRNANVCNYVGSMGPQCVGGGPFHSYCNGANFNPPLNFVESPDHGSGRRLDRLRGMFNRAGSRVMGKHVLDGTSNVILLGETLAGEQGFYAEWDWAPQRKFYFKGMRHSRNWAENDGGNAHGTTIVPLNFRTPCPDGAGYYGGPCDDRTIAFGFKSNHTNGANFAMVDGSVHFFTNDISHRTYNALGCRDDGVSWDPDS